MRPPAGLETRKWRPERGAQDVIVYHAAGREVKSAATGSGTSGGRGSGTQEPENSMRPLKFALIFGAGILAGCMAAGPSTVAQTPAPPSGPMGSPFADRNDFVSTLATPLL